MTLLTTLIAFIVTLGILIVIHELGHYWVARRCGVKVLRFSIGFGRPLLRFVRGADQTEWVVAAVPLGGYVRMLDENDPDVGPISSADVKRAFNRQPVWRRIAIVSAGPIANLLLAIVVYWMLNLGGVMEPRAQLAQPSSNTPAQAAGIQRGDVVAAVNDEPVRSWSELHWLLLQHAVERKVVDLSVQSADGVSRNLRLDLGSLDPNELDGSKDPLAGLGIALAPGPLQIGKITPGSSAERAGLQSGDRILELERQPVGSAQQMIDRVRAQPEQPLALLIEREGRSLTLNVTPQRLRDDSGKEVGRIGAELSDRPELVSVQYGVLEGFGLAVKRTWEMAIFSLRMLGKMITGEASWRNLSGPVTIADYAGKSANLGLSAYLSFLALVSISLGVLNLLPIPMLDGGHLVYYAVELIKGSPPADWVMQWGQRAGIGVLVFLTALALYNDLTRLLL